jgi:hypothetical protein
MEIEMVLAFFCVVASIQIFPLFRAAKIGKIFICQANSPKKD